MPKAKVARLDHETYLREREHLSRFEAQTWEAYERTILTLSSAFLAFSVSFLALIKPSGPDQAASLPLASPALLFGSWLLFGASVLVMLSTFLLNAASIRFEVDTLELALEDQRQLSRVNSWDKAAMTCYFTSGLAFVGGLALLLSFAYLNFLG